MDKDAVDHVICGGAMEGHKLQKEVNYSHGRGRILKSFMPTGTKMC